MTALRPEATAGNVRARRRELGLSVAGLAARAGIGERTVFYLESGRVRPQEYTRDAVAAVLWPGKPAQRPAPRRPWPLRLSTVREPVGPIPETPQALDDLGELIGVLAALLGSRQRTSLGRAA